MSRLHRIAAATLFLLCAAAGSAVAQTTATQTFNTTLSTIRAISVSTGTAVDLVINAATPGSAPTTVGDSSTTYAITSNDSSVAKTKITGKISIGGDMPTDVTLTANLTAPSGGTSAGRVALTTSDQNLVTAIVPVIATGLKIEYRLNAAYTAKPYAVTSRTITFTIAAGA